MKIAVVKKTFSILLVSAILSSPLYGISQAQTSPAGIQTVDQDWYELSPRERSRALENYERFQRLPPEKQRHIEERYNRWRGLPPEERDRIRRNYERYRGMDDDEQEEFRRKYKKWRKRSRED